MKREEKKSKEGKMTKRKIALLLSCAILLCIYIVQVALSAAGKTQKVLLDEKEIDKIVLSRGADSEDILLVKEGDSWTVGEAKYAASQSAIDSMLSALKSINILEKAGKASEASKARYEFGDKAITVRAYSADKVLRTLVIGKNSAASSQTYALLDGSSDISLISGGVRDTFDKDISALRSRIVYKLDENTMKKVTVTYQGETLCYEKDADSPEWKPALGTPKGDADKVSSWAKSLYSVSASSWMSDGFVLEGKPIATARIESADDFVDLNIYRREEEGDNEGDGKEDAKEAKYYCTASSVPYTAELSSYAAGKYLKTASDFEK